MAIVLMVAVSQAATGACKVSPILFSPACHITKKDSCTRVLFATHFSSEGCTLGVKRKALQEYAEHSGIIAARCKIRDMNGRTRFPKIPRITKSNEQMDERRHTTSLCLNISTVCILHSHCLESSCSCQ
ncbi:hypothetical protein M441DRAFT_254425 [Trichoderma asperellum CBS 433.97]|uniref:Secreted protein n=1 Tax=Trichoderma asperellum (strain ATCC 204424 / CBS 433.97 / NBRC 101777) TaxID=1042311 RepID=A0A2T3YYH9_TRIA4|nr:hypothetical protein M441DRAFT_254425 [Trichoderma asperellum CBS 433.97]PTB37596.1 hypothetical protein M441DRAFT_254425 [Trichoderma asperellum CBS 433.97]